MEEHPSEIFTNTSADKCWESVLLRLNHETEKLRNQGERELPPLELLKTINGHKMFGFLSPSIMQVMQTNGHLRYSHLCFTKITSRLYYFSNIELYSQSFRILIFSLTSFVELG